MADEQPGAKERAIEALWIAALVAVPLLFNVDSRETFELDKTVLLTSLALVVAVLVSLHLVEGGWSALRDTALRVRGWALLGVAVVVVQLAAAFWSIHPRASLVGAAPRYQGALTTAAYVTFFLTIVYYLRSERQLARLSFAAIGASIPVALYAVFQAAGHDPVSWTDGPVARVSSTLGNPIYFGAFLVLVLPLVVHRLLESARGSGLHLAALAAAVAAVTSGWLAGPLTGFAAAAALAAVAALDARRRRRPARTVLQTALYGAILSLQLASLLLAESRGPWLGVGAGLFFLALIGCLVRRRRALGVATVGLPLLLGGGLAFVNLVETPFSSAARELPYVGRFAELSRSTAQVRLVIWESAESALSADPGRFAFGHGPETVRLALASHTSAELGQIELRGAVPDRAHNETLDALLTTGALGAGVQLVFLLGLLATGLRASGVADMKGVLGAGTAGAALAPVAARSLDGSWRLAGPAVVPGLLAGVVGYLLVRAFRDRPMNDSGPTSREKLAAVLVAALVGHAVETQFGIAVTTTRLYFFVFAGVLVALATGRFQKEPEAPRAQDAIPTAALALVVLAYGLAPSPVALSPTLAVLLVLPAVGFAFWVAAEGEARAPAIRLGLHALGAAVVFLLVQLAWLGIRGHPASRTEALYAFIFIGTAFWATRGVPSRPAFVSKPTIVTVVLVGAALAFVFGSALDAVRADVDFRQAGREALSGRLELALRHAEAAVSRRPHHDGYLAALGRLHVDAARSSEPPGRGDAFSKAETRFRQALSSSPREPEHHRNLARLYASWAASTVDAAARGERFLRALRHASDAIALQPKNVLLWNERGIVRAMSGDVEAARSDYEAALALDDGFANAHAQLGELALADGRLDEAASRFQNALARTSPEDAVPVLLRLAEATARLGRIDEAIRLNRRVLSLQTENPVAHKNLASLYFIAGDLERSLVHTERAIERASPQDRAPLEALRLRLLEATRGGRD